MARSELVRGVFVIGVVRQQDGKDRIPPDGVISGPFLRRSHGLQAVVLQGVGHCVQVISFLIASLGHAA